MSSEWIEVKNKKKIRHKQPIILTKNNLIDDKAHKKILCNNILMYGKCCYTNKCLYAHNLTEQTLEPIRKIAYDIIINNKQITREHNDNKALIDTFLTLSKTCFECEHNKCPGGYNCKYGAITKKYTVCYNNLISGICTYNNCIFTHLTKQGLVSINPLPKRYDDIHIINDELSNIPIEIVQSIPQAKMLNSEYFMDNENMCLSDSDESTEETSINKDIETLVLNSTIDLCNRSIFE